MGSTASLPECGIWYWSNEPSRSLNHDIPYWPMHQCLKFTNVLNACWSQCLQYESARIYVGTFNQEKAPVGAFVRLLEGSFQAPCVTPSTWNLILVTGHSSGWHEGMGGMGAWIHGTYFILVYTHFQHFRQILLHQSGGIFTCQKCSKMFCCRSFEFKQQAVTSKKLAIYWINLNFGLKLTSPNTLT